MDIDKETESQIQELQILEQNIQAILMQKQNFQAELSEVENALEELNKNNEDVYKIVGNIMIKSKADNIKKEIAEKQEFLSLRMKSMELQEKSISEKAEELRRKVLKKIGK